MTARSLGLVAVLALGLAGCTENLATPGDCPALCPGDRITVKDTVITATTGADSTYFGYALRSARQSLLVSSGLAAGEHRSFVVFGKVRTDSISVDATLFPLVVDTIALSFQVEVRDTTATNLQMFLYRIPIRTDTSISFDSLETFLTPANLLDSARMSDTLKAGRIEAIFTEDELARLVPAAEDSGRFGVAIRVRADQPTGLRLALDPSVLGTGPLFEYRGTAVGVVDTTKRRQKVGARREDNGKIGFVQNRDLATNANPDLLYIGGPSGARSLIRFVVPASIRDSTQILRATLQLTPAEPLVGLPNRRAPEDVAVLGIITDLGAKSPTTSVGAVPHGALAQGTSNAATVDVIALVSSWQTAGGAPQALVLQHSDELNGGGFMQPVFYSSRSATGRPTLRITYGVPTKPGQP